MNQSRRNSNANDNDARDIDNDRGNSWFGPAAIGAAIAATGFMIYMYSSRSTENQTNQAVQSQRRSKSARAHSSPTNASAEQQNTALSTMTQFLLSSVFERMNMSGNIGISRSAVPENPQLNNLNALLDDIYVRFVALKSEDFELYYGVFSDIFAQLQEKMKDVDPYYGKYSSRKQFAGSHFDNLRIKKPDEFDMDIVIGLPLNFKLDPNNAEASDIVIQNQSPGFVQLKLGTQFEKLPMRDAEEWQTNKVAYNWKDDKGFLLRKNFIQWFKSVIHRALNQFENVDNKFKVYVKGVPYIIKRIDSETSPAVTFIIENNEKDFQLDVDFVPALKFPEKRWPICQGYRNIPPGCNTEDFMVVPKQNKDADDIAKQRGWRLAFHCQEKKLLHNLNNLKPSLRLIKKLRDTQGMKEIASYYIKTLFLHEVVARNNPSFWNQDRATLFKIMVKKLHEAITIGNIPYFWNPKNNLIGGVSKNVLVCYESKLKKLLEILEQPKNYKSVAEYLLTPEEFSTYNTRFLRSSL